MMKNLLYYLLYGFAYLISLLPFKVLYGLSDCIWFLIFRHQCIHGIREDYVHWRISVRRQAVREQNRPLWLACRMILGCIGQWSFLFLV